MLSVFPSLLSWNQLSPFLLRLVLGLVLIFWAYSTYKGSIDIKGKIVAGVQAITATMLIIGLWTQIAALIAAVYLAFLLGEKVSKKAFLTDGVNYYLILFVIALSLLFTGAGALSFDLPL